MILNDGVHSELCLNLADMTTYTIFYFPNLEGDLLP